MEKKVFHNATYVHRLKTEFKTAVQTGQKEIVYRFIQCHFDYIDNIVNDNEDGYTYIIEACRNGFEDVVTLLTGFYTDLNKTTPEGITLLEVACENGYVDIVDTLLVNGCTVSTRPDSNPMLMAARYGWVTILEHLLQEKPDYIEYPSHLTQLCVSSSKGGHRDMVRFALQKLNNFPDLSIKVEVLQLMMTAACDAHHFDATDYLLSQGATITSDIACYHSEVIRQVLFNTRMLLKEEEVQSVEGKEISKIIAHWNKLGMETLHSDWLKDLRATELHLHDNELCTLPVETPWQLPNLIVLNLHNNNLLHIPEPPNTILCNSLSTVNLSHNQLTELPHQLFQVHSLIHLNLSHNKLLTLYSSASVCMESTTRHNRRSGKVNLDNVWGCHLLQYLDLSFNQLMELPVDIQVCCRLQYLKVANNRLNKLPSVWNCPLEELDVSHNLLRSLPVSMEDYWSESLVLLLLGNNKLTSLPQAVCRLAGLQELDLSNNLLTYLPNVEWWETSSLERLNLSHNMLTTVPLSPVTPLQFPVSSTFHISSRFSIGALQEDLGSIEFPTVFIDTLTNLDLSYNSLICVPPSVCTLKKLQILNLSYNPGIKKLATELGNLRDCFSLGLDGLSIKLLPRNLLPGDGYRSKPLLAHLNYLQRRCVTFNSCKVMVVGKECKGKTSLVWALKGSAEGARPTNVATNGVQLHHWKLNGSGLSGLPEKPELSLKLWDFAGQSDFYVTHKLFMSPGALYVLVFDLRTMQQGVHGLRPWLLDIQAHAPNSHVMIVGTFLDNLDQKGRSKISGLRKLINETYEPNQGFPQVTDVHAVSSKTREGIEDLMHAIYCVAIGVEYQGNGRATTSKNPKLHRDEPLTGKKVPKSYLDLAKAVHREKERREANHEMPVLKTKDMMQIAADLPDSDITSIEELDLATKFLVEAGILMHYSSNLRKLQDLFFINPSWLANMLSEFITVDVNKSFIKDGILDLSKAQRWMFKDDAAKVDSMKSYIDLLEKFEIAFQIDPTSVLLPSKLPATRPGFLGSQIGGTPTLHRLYLMHHTPSGLWPRLITQVLYHVIRHGQPASQRKSYRRSTSQLQLSESAVPWINYRVNQNNSNAEMAQPPKLTYWQNGIHVDTSTEQLCIESPCHLATSAGGEPLHGILITVQSNTHDYGALCFAVDQVEDLLHQWFIGLFTSGVGALKRVVPCPRCLHNHTLDNLWCVHLFPVHQCLIKYFTQTSGDTVFMECPKCEFQVEISTLLPEINFSDLPSKLIVAPEKLLYDSIADYLAKGGEGQVFKAKLTDSIHYSPHKETASESFQLVAVKENLIVHKIDVWKTHWRQSSSSSESDTPLSTHEQIDDDGGDCCRGGANGDSVMILPSGPNSDTCQSENTIWSSANSADFLLKVKLLVSFLDFRKEVVLLSQLKHPCVVTILGVVPQKLSIIMELAPMGSLLDVLNTELRRQGQNEPRSRQGDGSLAKGSGCLLGRDSTYQIVQQVCLGLEYLHAHGIIYRDLKPSNILVFEWSRDRSRVKLTDYGLAQYSSLQGVRGCEGTIAYQAPEMRKGQPYSNKVDVFALGITVHQIITGVHPFHKHPSVAIPRAIEEGKRPSLKECSVEPEMPALEKLMEACWRSSADQRPLVVELVHQLKNMSFYAQHRVFPDLLPRTLCVHKPTENLPLPTCQRGETSTVRFIAQDAGGCAYHVANVERGNVRFTSTFNKSTVMCMTLLGRHLVIGSYLLEDENQVCELHLVTNDRATGRLVQVAAPARLPDIPLAVVHIPHADGEHMDLYVTVAAGVLFRYVVKDASCSLEDEVFVMQSPLNLLEIAGVEIARAAAKCMLPVNGHELWVSCGPKIVVVNLHSDIEEQDHVVIDLTEIDRGTLVSQMCCHGDQIWCSLKGSWKVIEFDTNAKQAVSVIDVSCGTVLDVNIEICLEEAVMEQKKSAEKDEQADTAASPKSPSQKSPAKKSRLNTLRHKLSFGKKKKKSTEIQKEDQDRPSIAPRHRKHPSEKVRSLCYVNGTLWIGRASGDIVMVNVTRDNCDGFAYGQVIAILCNEYLAGYGNGSVEHLVNINNTWVAAFRVIHQQEEEKVIAARPTSDPEVTVINLKSDKVIEKTELVIWEAMGLNKTRAFKDMWRPFEDFNSNSNSKQESAKQQPKTRLGQTRSW